MFGGDDDDDFVPANNSKLAALFSSKSIGEGNSTLTYTAPKQPKKSTNVKNESRTSTIQPSTEQTRPSKEPSENMLSIIIVKAVNTYKFQDGKYNLQGKLGAAVLGNDVISVYQLLLYKGKQQHITTTKICSNFQFTVQASNYATFYDDNKQNWSIHFEKSEDAEEFAKEVGIARGNALGGRGIIKTLLTQEFFAGEGPSANLGDTLEIFYTVRSFVNSKLGEVLESNLQAEKPQRVKIRKNVWEEGLIGASKASKRIILLPSNLVGPWRQQVNQNGSIVVEVEVNKIKQAKSLTEDFVSAAASLADSGESALDSSTDETSIKARGASISEALTASPKTNKANIISRMAKMGQATLPLKGAIVCNPSDSEETEEEAIHSLSAKPPTTLKPSAKSRSSKRTRPGMVSSPVESTPPIGPLKRATSPPHQVTVYQTLPVTWPQQQQPQQYAHNSLQVGQYGVGQLDGQLYPLVPQQTSSSHQLYPASQNTMVGTPTGLAPSENFFSVFMSEARTQNTEVRMGMAKVADKVDLMLAKLDTTQSLKLPSSTSLMDASSLLASIQKLVTENEQLRTEVADKANKIEVQNDRIYQLLNTNHKYLEQSNCSTNDQRNQEALVASLQKAKVKLTEELCESKVLVESLHSEIETLKQENTINVSNMASQLKSLQDELSASKTVIVEQDMNMQKLKEKLHSSVEANESHEKSMVSLRTFVLELQDSKEKADVLLKDLTNQLKFQKLEAEDHERKLVSKFNAHIAALMEKNVSVKLQSEGKKPELPPVPKPVEEVKRVMNIVYKTLHREFSPEKQYMGGDIRDVLASTIRDITVQFFESSTDTVSGSAEPHTALPEHVVGATSEEAGADKVSFEPVQTHALSNLSGDFKAHLNIQKQETLPRQSQPPSTEVKSDNQSEFLTKTGGTGKSQVPPFENLGSAEYNVKDVNRSTVGQVQEQFTGTPDCPLPKLPTEVDAIPKDKKVSGDDKLETKQLEEKINRKLRESSIERKLWHSEPPPPPLLDDDEDEDDWLS